MNDRPQSEKPWLCRDGKPAQIHALLLQCQTQAASIVKDEAGTSAQDVIDTARAVLNDAGIVLRIAGHGAKAVSHGKGMFVEMSVHVDFCAPDGSYWPVSVDTGAMAPLLKSYSAALTVGIKSILRHTLLLHLVTNEVDARTVMPPALRNWHNVLLSFKDLESLDEGADHPARLAVLDDHLQAARNMYRERRSDLRTSLADDKAAYWEAKKAEGDAATEAGKPTKRNTGKK